jgi:16S rRNA (adenine1518-N6/adenine1519-N6)-dimethyltransferase
LKILLLISIHKIVVLKKVNPKKSLGQHFLKDENVARTIVDTMILPDDCKQVLEIGPGMGVLTDFLFVKKNIHVKIIDIDPESIVYLNEKFPSRKNDIIEGDFLQTDPGKIFGGDFAIIGNFPYNISSQILFRVLDFRNQIPEVVGMFQKEVAERIAGDPGGREYGILSVFMQTWFDVSMVMTLNESDFDPPPKVKSAVLHFQRKKNFILQCEETAFRRVVKTAFNQRRKTLRNALSSLVPKGVAEEIPFASLRAETLSWEKFVELTNAVEKIRLGK